MAVSSAEISTGLLPVLAIDSFCLERNEYILRISDQGEKGDKSLSRVRKALSFEGGQVAQSVLPGRLVDHFGASNRSRAFKWVTTNRLYSRPDPPQFLGPRLLASRTAGWSSRAGNLVKGNGPIMMILGR